MSLSTTSKMFFFLFPSVTMERTPYRPMAKSSKLCETWCVIGHHPHKLKKFGKWLFEVVGNTFGSVYAKFDNDIMFYC